MTSAMASFIEKVIIQDDGCWVWNGARNGGRRGGYGNVKYQGKWLKAHRLSYILFVGPIPDGLILLHSCDYPPCINPSHLTPGTSSENSKDMIKKGRSSRAKK